MQSNTLERPVNVKTVPVSPQLSRMSRHFSIINCRQAMLCIKLFTKFARKLRKQCVKIGADVIIHSSWVALFHDTRSNDSRSNDARFMHKLSK